MGEDRDGAAHAKEPAKFIAQTLFAAAAVMPFPLKPDSET
jgi:hypothetical protein